MERAEASGGSREAREWPKGELNSVRSPVDWNRKDHKRLTLSSIPRMPLLRRTTAAHHSSMPMSLYFRGMRSVIRNDETPF